MAPFLPPKLISFIISYIEEFWFAPYASINLQWKAAIEETTFRTLTFTTARLAQFQHILSPRRSSVLQSLCLKITPPEYSIAERGEVETNLDRSQNNQAFTDTIGALFDILSWPHRTHTSNIDLYIISCSFSDHTEEPPSSLRGLVQQEADLLQWRCKSSYLEFVKPANQLPILDSITSLTIHTTWNDRNIAPATVSTLLFRLPRLRQLIASLTDNERKNVLLRDTLRDDLSSGLSHWPGSLEHLNLEYSSTGPKDGTYPPSIRSKPDLDPSPPPCDRSPGA
ncbi:hypothetical protein BDV12DRAFT_196308 [Aspergillus spectabilis]